MRAILVCLQLLLTASITVIAAEEPSKNGASTPQVVSQRDNNWLDGGLKLLCDQANGKDRWDCVNVYHVMRPGDWP